MQRLGAFVGVMALAILVDPGWAATYVPGQVRDGTYIRPHFVAAPERVALEIGDPRSDGLPEVAPGPAVLDRPATSKQATSSES